MASSSKENQVGKREKKHGSITVEGDRVVVAVEKDRAVFGSTNEEFINGLIHNIVNIASPGREIDEVSSKYLTSIVAGINPQDEVEALLATQMAAIHMATVTFSRRLANVETIPQQDSAERALNKLARTFTAQVEALKRYRTGGQQNVTVKHVNVNEGGQAIVGNVHHGGRGGEKS